MEREWANSRKRFNIMTVLKDIMTVLVILNILKDIQHYCTPIHIRLSTPLGTIRIREWPGEQVQTKKDKKYLLKKKIYNFSIWVKRSTSIHGSNILRKMLKTVKNLLFLSKKVNLLMFLRPVQNNQVKESDMTSWIGLQWCDNGATIQSLAFDTWNWSF